jgi:hypothetical protein
MLAVPQAATAAHREAAAVHREAAATATEQQWAEPQYYYTPEGYLHQRSDADPYLGTVQAGPWVTGYTSSIKKNIQPSQQERLYVVFIESLPRNIIRALMLEGRNYPLSSLAIGLTLPPSRLFR